MHAEGDKDSPFLPTDLSIIRDKVTGFLVTSPTEVITKIAETETVALSPGPTLPPGAPFPWLDRVLPTPTSEIPMISGYIPPTIIHEALLRTLGHKAAGPDGVSGLVLKHMPPSFHETIHILFQSMVIVGITPPSWLKIHTILLKKNTPRGWITNAPSH